MNEKELKIILNNIHNAADSIELLAFDHYPSYSECKDSDIRDMFYQLLNMSGKLYSKIKEVRGNV